MATAQRSSVTNPPLFSLSHPASSRRRIRPAKAKRVAVGRVRRSVTASLHSQAVRGDALNCRSPIIYADLRLYKLATLNPSQIGVRD
jgi:hypothetical protein